MASLISRIRKVLSRVKSVLSEDKLNTLQSVLNESVVRQNEIAVRQNEIAVRQNEIAVRQNAIEMKLDTIDPKLITETDRLDSYLNYHAHTLEAKLDTLESRLITDTEKHSGRTAPIIITVPNHQFLVIDDDYIFIIPGSQLGLLTFLVSHKHKDIELGVQRAIRKILKAGDVAVDVGANFGLHSVVMASMVGKRGKVVCFEPQSHMASALEESMVLNGFQDRTFVMAEAVSDGSGVHEFYESPHSPMSSFFLLPDSKGVRNTSVKTISLDEYFPAGTKLSLVKVDAEGAEPLVYGGMKRIVAENRNISIILEWSATHFIRAGKNPVEFFQTLCQDGFVASLISDSSESISEPLAADQIGALDGANILLSRV